MSLSPLTAISPIDGRYRSTVAPLSRYFSELALMRYRVLVEIEYFLALAALPLPELAAIGASEAAGIRAIHSGFTEQDGLRIKQIEAVTNHDVKAVELFLGERFEALGLGRYRSFLHFGLTSQDVNDNAIPMALRDAIEEAIAPALEQLLSTLQQLAAKWRDQPMLARTHGQPATPTRVGKELMVFVERLERELRELTSLEYLGKLGGATGGLNAHYLVYPEIGWTDFATCFLERALRLRRPIYTTQIGHHEGLSRVFDTLSRICGVLLDLAQDAWLYIMQGYFVQAVLPGEVGSSAMPHKVNPIEFENAEGNLGVAVAGFTHLARKLAVSRLQRDLTDYTVKRNIGVPVAHLLLSVRNLGKGLLKLALDEAQLRADLESNWAVLAEAMQTALRRRGDAGAYDRLKELTRGKSIDRESMRKIVGELGLDQDLAPRFEDLDPASYLGPVLGAEEA
jgi:adenylosuccinate lyase